MIKTLLVAVPVGLMLMFVSFGATGQTPVAQATPSIGYVTGQRIFAEVPDVNAGFARLQALQQQKSADLAGKQQALEGTRQRLATAGDGQTRTQLQQQEQQQRTDLERATAQAQTDLQAAQRQVQVDFQARLTPILAELAKARNLQIVLNGEASVLWAAPGLDLTPAVIERLKANPPPTNPPKP